MTGTLPIRVHANEIENRVNTERCSVFLCIQSECGKIRTRTTPNTDTFYAVLLERTKNSNTPKNENGVNVLVHCNIVSNDCDQYSKVVYRRFVSNNLPFRISTY